MQITNVAIRRFRGFKDFSLPLTRFTNLVGQNSRGKTTVLQAIQFVFDSVDVARTNAPSTSTSVRIDSSTLVSRLSLNDMKSIWHEKDASQPFEIELTFDNGYRLALSNPAGDQATLSMFDGRTPIPALRGPEWKELAAVAEVGSCYIPPIGATSGLEVWRSHPSFQQALGQGLHSEIWRNSLYWQYNDGDKSAFDDAVEMVKRYINVETILPPRQGHEHSPAVVIEYVENGQVYDIGLSGSGMRSLLNLATVLLLSRTKVVMLDEPDAHLHSTLQRAVARMIQDYAFDHDVQVLVATHAPDFISECEVDSIVWVDKESSNGEKASELSRILVDLGSLKSAEVFQSKANSKLLFVEGDLDRKLLIQLFQRIDPSLDVESLRIAKLPSGKSSSVAVPMAVEMLKNSGLANVKVACLVDRDWEIVEKPPLADQVYVLPIKEIENLFLDLNVICAAVIDEFERRKKTIPDDVQLVVMRLLESACDDQKASVRSQLRWRYCESLPKDKDRSTREDEADQWFERNWYDQEWRLKTVGGKKALRQVRNGIQQAYGLSVTTLSLLSAMASIPEDVETCLRKISGHLKD